MKLLSLNCVRQFEIQDGGIYPRTSNPDYRIAAGTRDCAVDYTGSAWEFYPNEGEPVVGFYVFSLCKDGIGLSWSGIEIPSGFTMTAANIKSTAYYSDSVGTVRTKITGQIPNTQYNIKAAEQIPVCFAGLLLHRHRKLPGPDPTAHGINHKNQVSGIGRQRSRDIPGMRHAAAEILHRR